MLITFLPVSFSVAKVINENQLDFRFLFLPMRSSLAPCLAVLYCRHLPGVASGTQQSAPWQGPSFILDDKQTLPVPGYDYPICNHGETSSLC